jgi:lipoprotein-anchoring transpeptidase ErfK/SrfK
MTDFARTARPTAVALAAVLWSTAAIAGPFPFFDLHGRTQTPDPATQERAPADEPTAPGVPENLRRQVVPYQTTEAPGTIVIDTPHTYLYLVLGNGKAMRYGIGLGREGFTWSGVQTIARKQEWPDWVPPPEMLHRQPYLPRFMAGGPATRSARAPCISAAPSIASTAPTPRIPSGIRCRAAASAWSTTT